MAFKTTRRKLQPNKLPLDIRSQFQPKLVVSSFISQKYIPKFMHLKHFIYALKTCIPCIFAYINIERSEVNTLKSVYDHSALNSMKKNKMESKISSKNLLIILGSLCGYFHHMTFNSSFNLLRQQYC